MTASINSPGAARVPSMLDYADKIIEGGAAVAKTIGETTANPIALGIGAVLTAVDSVLDQRQGTHGDFSDNADIADAIQTIMQGAPNWKALSSVQRQALTNISSKISRILSGDPNYADNWVNIQGYAKLAQDRLPVPAAQVSSVNTQAATDAGQEAMQDNAAPITPVAADQHPDVLAAAAGVSAAVSAAAQVGLVPSAVASEVQAGVSAVNAIAQVATSLRS